MDPQLYAIIGLAGVAIFSLVIVGVATRGGKRQ